MEERDGRKFVDSKPLNNDFDLTLRVHPATGFRFSTSFEYVLLMKLHSAFLFPHFCLGHVSSFRLIHYRSLLLALCKFTDKWNGSNG